LTVVTGPVDSLQAARELQAVSADLEDHMATDFVRAGGRADRLLWAKAPLCLLGTGEALRIPLPAGWARPEHVGLVQEVLATIAGPGRAGRPVAIGALPYDPGRGGHMSVPRLLLRASHGICSATLVAPASTRISPDDVRQAAQEELRRARDERRAPELPDSFELSATMPHGQWLELVARAVADIGRGRVSKVVLARRVDVVGNRPFDVGETLARLASLYPSCAMFHVEGFIGASPETLVARHGLDVMSHPLAGTVARSGDDGTDRALLDALMSSAKDRHEHKLVVDAIASQLRPLCTELEVPAGPSVLALRNVSHLGTVLRGSLRAGEAKLGQGGGAGARSVPNALQLAALLQPTPAVGGHPVGEALSWQREHEGFDRGCYAGPVGWMDSEGDGELALGLRSANVLGRHASLYAGSGIVAGSDPATELAETQLKLQALLAALVRP
jgi:menaquinone-specific isochorismate synthase